MKSDYNILTGRSEEHLLPFEEHFLHQDIIIPFTQLRLSAKDEIGAELNIISSFRSYQRQLLIWNEKVLGKRIVKNKDGDILDLTDMNDEDKFKSIARFSAIPGASRHHWGTDLDIFDAKKRDKKDVLLEPWECEVNGPFYKLHNWLDEKIQNAQSFDFKRPYDSDKGGIYTEKWHISYAPISLQYEHKYTQELFIKNISESNILLKDYILANAESIYTLYVANLL